MTWKMLSAEMAVTLAVAVGPRLPRVAVSTSDRLPEALTERVGNGWSAGLPDVSRPVGMIYDGSELVKLSVGRTVITIQYALIEPV